MHQNPSADMRPLTDEEVSGVSGANILIYGAPVVAGFLIGTGIRMAADKLLSWLFD